MAEATVSTPTSTRAGSADSGGPVLRVSVVDLSAVVPYYTAHLCAALGALPGVDASLASIDYQHDLGCFERLGVRTDSKILNFTTSLRRAPAILRRSLKAFELLANLAILLARFALRPPDAVHVQFFPLIRTGLPFELWWMKLVRATGARIVYTVHNVLPQDDGERSRKRYQEVYATADHLICHDQLAKTRLIEEFGIAPEKVTIVAHAPLFAGVAAGSVEEARAMFGFAPGEVVFLCQGILKPYKGLPFLLDSWSEVQQKYPQARLVIAGTGEASIVEELKQKVEQLQLQNSVTLDLRFIPLGVLSGLYRAADVLLYPYREITTSGALLTGIVQGKPMVATDLPAFRALITHDRDGLLAPYGDTSTFAAELGRLIEDESLRQRLSTGVRLLAAEYPQWDSVAKATEACYRGVRFGLPNPQGAAACK